MAEEEAKRVAENEMINGGVDGDEEDDEEEVINEARGWLMRRGAGENKRLMCNWLFLTRVLFALLHLQIISTRFIFAQAH